MSKINYIKIARKSAGIQISELKKINKVFNKSCAYNWLVKEVIANKIIIFLNIFIEFHFF